MKTFHIYAHPHNSPREAVKVGFSWPALFFSFLWMLAKKLWGLAAIWFVAYFVCTLIEKRADMIQAKGGDADDLYLFVLLSYLVLCLLPAFWGNEWRERNLVKRGYQFLGAVQAATPEGALAIQPDELSLASNKTAALVKSVTSTMPMTPAHVQPRASTPAGNNAAIVQVDEDAIYSMIAQELEAGTTDKGLWTRLFAECEGDENKTKARYISVRAERLIAAELECLERLRPNGLAPAPDQNGKLSTP